MSKIKNITILVLVLLLFSCNQEKVSEENQAAENKEVKTTHGSVNSDIKPIYLTTADFKEKIWDYEANPNEWKYKGELPCIIDFYADWCKPCKMVAPIMDDLADHYDGKVIIYKVDTDKEKELASVFQVRSIPSILFAPMEGKPAMQPGAMQKEDYMNIIEEYVLKVNKEDSKI
ncbi:MAG: thiol reductase thioredoxin [Bacteroidales bacterium]|nr:thiol reductase thioredoxin [Bacteroidales bacterium]